MSAPTQEPLHPDLDLGVARVPALAEEARTPGELVIVVHGEPHPQGSLTRGRWGGLYAANAKKLDPWRDSIALAAAAAMTSAHPDQGLPLHPRGAPVAVNLVFTFPRPAGHFGTGRNTGTLRAAAPAAHVTRPDLDKCARAAIDSLAAAGVFADDTQVIAISTAKTYPGGHVHALPIPGALIRIRAVTR